MMDRRNFLKVTAAGAAGMAFATDSFGKGSREDVFIPEDEGKFVPLQGTVNVSGTPGGVSDNVGLHVKVEGYVKEPSHRVPVVAEVDVVVVGGGPAGVSAAVCAARQGASVILVEKANFLGGLWSGGLVLPVLATHGKGKVKSWDKASGGFCAEICDELLGMGMAVNPLNPNCDPEATKYVLDKAIHDSGVRILYNATAAGVIMSGDRVEALLLDCNTGRLAIRCRAAVDASGDGCLFNWTGDPHEERLYHINTSYRVGNAVNNKFGSITPIANVKFRTIGDRELRDGLDIFSVSGLQQEHRLGIWERITQQKEELNEKDAFLLDTAPVTGVRITRILDSIHIVTLEESMEWTRFDDVIGMAGACDPFTYKGKYISNKERPVWQIPYRALIPKKTKNILACGRCFGFDEGITWDAREISTCMVTGQAAGTAAAMAVTGRCAMKDLDIRRLQSSLKKQNVRLNF